MGYIATWSNMQKFLITTLFQIVNLETLMDVACRKLFLMVII